MTTDEIGAHMRGFFQAVDATDPETVSDTSTSTASTVNTAGLPGDGTTVGREAIPRDIASAVHENHCLFEVEGTVFRGVREFMDSPHAVQTMFAST